MLLNWPAFVLERRINQPLSAVRAGLQVQSMLVPDAPIPVGPDGALRLHTPLGPTLGSYDLAWRADARLVSERGRLIARVELEVDAWSAGATRLQLRPRALHPERWRGRRLRRYFTLAHQAVDHTASQINQLVVAQEADRLHRLVSARST
jgi:hypothetical protein